MLVGESVCVIALLTGRRHPRDLLALWNFSLCFSWSQALPSGPGMLFSDSASPVGSVRSLSTPDLKDPVKAFVSKLLHFYQSIPRNSPLDPLNNISVFCLKPQIKIKNIISRNGSECCLVLANLTQTETYLGRGSLN